METCKGFLYEFRPVDAFCVDTREFGYATDEGSLVCLRNPEDRKLAHDLTQETLFECLGAWDLSSQNGFERLSVDKMPDSPVELARVLDALVKLGVRGVGFICPVCGEFETDPREHRTFENLVKRVHDDRPRDILCPRCVDESTCQLCQRVLRSPDLSKNEAHDVAGEELGLCPWCFDTLVFELDTLGFDNVRRVVAGLDSVWNTDRYAEAAECFGQKVDEGMDRDEAARALLRQYTQETFPTIGTAPASLVRPAFIVYLQDAVKKFVAAPLHVDRARLEDVERRWVRKVVTMMDGYTGK